MGAAEGDCQGAPAEHEEGDPVLYGSQDRGALFVCGETYAGLELFEEIVGGDFEEGIGD